MAPNDPTRVTAALLPLLVAPLVAVTLVDRLDAVPAFVRGLVEGASLILLLGFCIGAGAGMGVARRRADDQKLDDLDPFGGLPRNEDGAR
jgi:hypothetical protein